MRARSCGQLAGQVGDHGAFEAGGKAHVVHDAYPPTVRVERSTYGAITLTPAWSAAYMEVAVK